MSEQASSQLIPRIYTLQEINAVISSQKFGQDLIQAIENGFVSYSKKDFNACPIQTMGAPPMAPFTSSESIQGEREYAAQTCVKSGYLTGASHYVIKVASGGHPLPDNSGLMQLFSQKTGRLEAILLDEGVLTELRTAAVGAVAASYLAPKTIHKIGMLGTGIQARYQLQYLALVTECRNVLVSGRTQSNVTKFLSDMAKQGWTVEVANETEELLTSCDLIVTTTSAREPLLLRTKNNQRAQHITCIGADATGKMELDPTSLVAKADLLVADCRRQTQERGEFEEALRTNRVSNDDVVELGELIGLKALHRGAEGDRRLTIFDSSGVAVQDCVIAKMVYDALLMT